MIDVSRGHEHLAAVLLRNDPAYPVLAHKVTGVKVHDARLVAAMMVHGITTNLTTNVGDFRRYPGITAIAPDDIK